MTSTSLFLAPHNDDETLFGSYTLLREKPHVIVVLRSFVQEERGCGITYQEREAETARALEILEISSWEQWIYPDNNPPWELIRRRLGELEWAGHVYAPAWEERGHPHHNRLSREAASVFPDEQLTLYMTYEKGTGRTRSRGRPVEVLDPAWHTLKRAALDCYASQIRESSTRPHFVDTLEEFYK